MFKIQFILTTDFGKFTSEEINVDQDNYDNIIKHSQTYYKTGFEMTTEDGTFVIFPPTIIEKSILQIKKII